MTRQVSPGLERAARGMFTKILASLARTLRDDDMSVAHAAALHVIDQNDETTIGQLAETIGASMSTASRLVDDLVKRGWVTRTESPRDRRVRVLSLTKQGEDFVARASAARVETILSHIDEYVPRRLSSMVFRALGRRRD